ncbi:glycosyltransferase [Cyclobacterium plantarum]|uniref:Glycosyltransferase n=1 Tax=Cyclobacterium plantarum TaxID=2716263 RepID=A0ABX0H3P9_9BACT|nr:glycosyltransferase [Cyclobacterium plantarum]NHE56244.1 glycosyltransferase [Cyclobacterium plantarum]
MNKSSDITVSVCMITYNHSKFLEMSIEGVLLQQTNFNVELIISDDASPDGTEVIVERYLNIAHENINVVYYKHSNNLGAIPNFEWTLNKCTGKYIAICEGDDYWIDPKKLQLQVDFLESNKNYILSFHDRSIVNNVGEVLKKNSLPTSIKRDLNFEDLAKGVFTVPTQTVVFRNCIKNFPKVFSSVLNGDTFLFLLLAERGKFYYEKRITETFYRIHNGGVWSSINYERSLLESYNTYNIIYNYFNKHHGLEKAFLTRWYGLIYFYWKSNNFPKFSIKFIKIILFVILNPRLISVFVPKIFKYIYKFLNITSK